MFSRGFTSAEIKEFAGTRQGRVLQSEGRVRLSIVLPSYNQAAFLRRTLNTIANQHYPNLQLIVMDGGSSDGSQAIIEEFRDIVSVYETGPDGGQASAINKGLSKADGDFVAWQNSDDLYLPGFFHAVDAAATLHPDADLIIANSYVIDATDEVLWATKYGPFSLSYLAYIGWNLTSQSVFVGRGLAERVGELPNYNVAFDYEWFLRVAVAARNVVELKRYGGCYRVHRDSKFSTAETDAREKLELRILARLGYAPDLRRSLSEQWPVRRAMLRGWQRLNERLLYTPSATYRPARLVWASILKLSGKKMLGYTSNIMSQS